MVLQIKTKSEFTDALEEAGDKLVVVDFFATWCGPCKRIAPLLDQLTETHKDKVVFLKIDVDINETESVVTDYAVTSMPTFVFIHKGKQVDKFPGADAERLKKTILDLLSKL